MGNLPDLFPIATEYYPSATYSLLIFLVCSGACLWMINEVVNMYLKEEIKKSTFERMKFIILILVIIYTGSLGILTEYLYFTHRYFIDFKLF